MRASTSACSFSNIGGIITGDDLLKQIAEINADMKSKKAGAISLPLFVGHITTSFLLIF
jgi:hypothetical protein